MKALVPSSDGLVKGSFFLRRDRYETSTGTRVFHAHHYHGGLRVFRSSQVVKVHRGQKPHSTPALFHVPTDIAVRPVTRPFEAVTAALAFFERRGLVPEARTALLREICLSHLVEAPAVVEVRDGLRSPARMHLEIFPQPRKKAELAWVGDLELEGGRRFYVAVSATRTRPAVLFAAQTNTCAFSADWVPVPSTTETRTFPIPTLTTPDGNPAPASQWQTGTLAAGPNASCHHGDATTVEPLGTLPVDNAFVWCNVLHDFFAAFGFDSAHHAFDGADPLRIEQLTQKSFLAGEFDNVVDGWSPKMVLYASPDGAALHAGTDPTIVVHEYMHGVSNRLVGGDACQYPFLGAQASGFNEGMSDYFALTVVSFLDRSRGGQVDIRTFGGRFKPGGIRDYGTSTGIWTPGQKDPYRIGEAWCHALLDSRTAILNPPQPSPGPDVTDRFLWQACINMLKSMAPICKASLSLTLKHAKDAFVTEATALENAWPLPGAAAKITNAFSGRGIS